MSAHLALEPGPVAPSREELDTVFRTVRVFKNFEGKWRPIWSLPLAEFCASGTSGGAVQHLRSIIERLNLSDQGAGTSLISIPPLGENGFSIDVVQQPSGVRAWFGEMEHEFLSLYDALPWVGRALSANYRLRTTLVSGASREYHLEPKETATAGAGVLSAGQIVFLRTFRHAEETIRHNTLLASD